MVLSRGASTVPEDITAVIPTCNRPESLSRTLDSLAAQTSAVREVLVIDSSDTLSDPASLNKGLPGIPLRVVPSRPHVCVQRNLGIRQASGKYILLLDDDIELPSVYVETLALFLRNHPEAGAASGLVLEPSPSGEFDGGCGSLTLSDLLSAFLFQHGLWGDVSRVRIPQVFSLPGKALKGYFHRRGNTFSLAGWPLFTRVEGEAVRTSVYGLGASIVLRSWLLESPFDESLDSHGIGDNYGVAIGFPGHQPITVLSNLKVRHHRVQSNRLPPDQAYYKRVTALHNYIRAGKRFPRGTSVFLMWSLAGRYLLMTVKGEHAMRKSAGRAILNIMSGRDKS